MKTPKHIYFFQILSNFHGFIQGYINSGLFKRNCLPGLYQEQNWIAYYKVQIVGFP